MHSRTCYQGQPFSTKSGLKQSSLQRKVWSAPDQPLRTEPHLRLCSPIAVSGEAQGQLQAVNGDADIADRQIDHSPGAGQFQILRRDAVDVAMGPAAFSFCKAHLPALPGEGFFKLFTPSEEMDHCVFNRVFGIPAADLRSMVSGEVGGDFQVTADFSVIDFHIFPFLSVC